MAGEAVVGALRAVLGLDTASFEEGAKKAVADLQVLQKGFLKIAGALGAAFSTAAITAAIKETVNQLEELNKVSQKIGVPVEELSALKFAAGLADISLQDLSSSLVKLAKNMSEVAKGSAGPAADAFRALGISVQNTDGTLRSQTDVIGDLADAFQGFKDSAEKTALSVAIFGKAGAAMIPLLNQGRIGLKQSADEAKRFGLIIDGETAAAAELFNDNLKRLHGASEGLTISLVQGMLPSLIKITDQMVETRDVGEGLVAIGEKIGRAFEYIAFVVKANIAGFTAFGQVLYGILGALAEATVGNFAAAMKRLDDGTKAANKTIFEFGKVYDAHFSDQNLEKIYRETEAWLNLNRGIEGAPPAIRDATKSLDNFIQSSADNINQMRAQVATFGQSEGAVAKLKFELQALAKIQHEGGVADEATLMRIRGMANEVGVLTNKLVALGQEKTFKEQIRSLGLQARETAGEFAGTLAPGLLSAASSLKILKEDGSNLSAVLGLTDEKARKLNDAIFLLNAQRLSQEFLTPYDLFLLKLKEIEASFARMPGGADLAAKASIKAAAEMATAYGNAAAAIVSPLASAFKDLASMNKKYAGLAKAAAIGEALVNTYLGATKAFTSTVQFGLPFAIAAAAAATAAGLANVAKISATQFATGGSFKVGGGMGGIDSQMISFKATPGEMVDIHRPGQERGGGDVTIQIPGGLRDEDMFTGRWLRGLVHALNGADRDGLQLKFAER